MNNVVCLILLAMTACFTCGFGWGFGHEDKCGDARKLIPSLEGQSGESETKQEDRILKLCADGGPGHYVRGVRLEQQGKWDEAIAEYRAAVAVDDNLAEAHGNLGLLILAKGQRAEAGVELTKGLIGHADPRYNRGLAELLREGKMDDLAQFHYRQALRAFPDDFSIHEGLAEVYARLGRLREAEEEFSAVVKAAPSDERACLGLAEVYRKEHRLDEAIAELSRAAALNPREQKINSLLAEVYKEKGDLSRAEKEYPLAGVTTTVTPEEYLRKGDEYFLAREYEKAIEKYEAALNKRPDWLPALEKLGDAHMAVGHDDEATAAYTKAVRVDAANSDLHYSLGVLYERQGRLDEATAEYQEVLRTDPANGDPRRRLADIYTLRGNYAQAVAEYKELIAKRADNPLLHVKLAKVYEKSRDFTEAIKEYTAAERLDAGNIETHKELAGLYARRGMAAEAEGEYRQVLLLKKDDRESRTALMALYAKQKQYDDLLAFLKEGVELFPKDPDSHYRLGVMYDFRKENDAAISQYQEALALKGDHARALYSLGKIYYRTGDFGKAREALQAAKQADPQFVRPAVLLNELDEETTVMSAQAVRMKSPHVTKSKASGKKKKSFAKNSRSRRGKHAGKQGRTHR